MNATRRRIALALAVLALLVVYMCGLDGRPTAGDGPLKTAAFFAVIGLIISLPIVLFANYDSRRKITVDGQVYRVDVTMPLDKRKGFAFRHKISSRFVVWKISFLLPRFR